MDNLITVELKQKNSGQVRSNGDYSTILTSPIQINEGDSINISKVFIDSVGEQQTSIIIPEDLNFTFSANIYNVNWNSDGKDYLNNNTENIDGKKYILCNRVPTPDIIGGTIIVSVVFELFNNYIPSWGGVSTTWEYKDLNNSPAQYHLYLPNIVAANPGTQTIDVGVLSFDGVFTLVSPTLAELENTYNTITLPQNINTEPVTGTVYNFIPISITKTISVLKGNYDPTFFAKMITDKLTANDRSSENTAPEFSPVSNPFLISTNDWIGNQSYDYFFIDSETGLNGFYYTPIPPDTREGGYWVGTNQMSLEFANNRFYWSNLHMPLYEQAGGNKIIQFVNPAVGTSITAIPVSSNSGIIFNTIKTDSTDPRYLNFFNTILGFNPALTIPVPQMTVKELDGNISFVPIYNWNKGNFTQGLNSIDAPIVKKSDKFYQVQSCLSLSTIIDDETQGVYADDIFTQTGFVFGYYQISIDSIFKHMLVGTNIKRNISALISRYYESNAYCSGNISDSISYTHIGEPIMLSSLSVRILNSDGNLATGLGNDNSIYLEIRKVIPQLEMKDKK